MNLAEATVAFETATRADEMMCDAWLGQIHVLQAQGRAVPDSLWFRAYRSRDRKGEQTDPHRLNHLYRTWVAVPGFDLSLPVRTADDLVIAHALISAAAGDREDSAYVLDHEIRDPGSSNARFAKMLLWRDAHRWDLISRFDWAGLMDDFGALSAAGEPDIDLRHLLIRFMVAEAAAHLGRSQAVIPEIEALSNLLEEPQRKEARRFLWPELQFLYGLALRETGNDERAEAVLSQLATYRGNIERFRVAAADPAVRLEVVDEDIIAARTDPWDPATQPSRAEAQAEQSRDHRAKLLAEADALMESVTGMEAVKHAIAKLRATTQMDQARKAKGHVVKDDRARHMVFVGSPGTGKTTIAKALGKYLAALGVVKTDKLVEATRADLVGEHLGSTAPKTNKIIDSALDGVLFIDEFYTLSQEGLSGGDAFGREAIDTLLKRMEDQRDRLVVIVAGYVSEMDRAISTNEGLKTRFARRLEFPSYNGHELMAIFESMAAAAATPIADDAKDYLAEKFTAIATTAHPRADKPGWMVVDELGNGRGVRNLQEKCEEERDVRLFSEGVDADSATLEELATITLADAQAAMAETLREAGVDLQQGEL